MKLRVIPRAPLVGGALVLELKAVMSKSVLRGKPQLLRGDYGTASALGLIATPSLSAAPFRWRLLEWFGGTDGPGLEVDEMAPKSRR